VFQRYILVDVDVDASSQVRYCHGVLLVK